MLYPSHKLVYAWRLRLLPLLAAGVLLWRPAARRFPAAAALGLTLLCGLCVLAAAYIPQLVRSFSYEWRGDALHIHALVYLRYTVVLPQARLLFARAYQTPLYGLFGLRGVALYGCGLRVFLPGLPREQADALLDQFGGARE